MPKKVLIDCDPGIDDAIALLLAAGNPAIEPVAITTVAGNQTLSKVTGNARRVAAAAGLDVPIAAGCDKPLVRAQVIAPQIHGDTGLGSVTWPEPSAAAAGVHGVDLMIDTVLASPGEVTIVALGPLTNVAMAVRKCPEIASAAAGIVVMGGSFTRGNQTPAAEFNMYVDPEAAHMVFAAGWCVAMVGVDVTRQAPVTSGLVRRLREIHGPLGRLVVDTMAFYDSTIGKLSAAGEDAPPASASPGPFRPGTRRAAVLHDPCAVAYAAAPDLFEVVDAVVQVETASPLTRGMTVTDFQLRGRAANASVATGLDTAGFDDLLVEAVAALPLGEKVP